MTSAFFTLTKGQGHTTMSNVTDVEVSAFSEWFLFIVIFFQIYCNIPIDDSLEEIPPPPPPPRKRQLPSATVTSSSNQGGTARQLPSATVSNQGGIARQLPSATVSNQGATSTKAKAKKQKSSSDSFEEGVLQYLNRQEEEDLCSTFSKFLTLKMRQIKNPRTLRNLQHKIHTLVDEEIEKEERESM